MSAPGAIDEIVEVVSEPLLQERVGQLGAEIAADYADEAPVAIGVLNGSVPFLADLSMHLQPELEIDFLSLTRFGRHGRVSVNMDTSLALAGRRVLLVEDIVDTGLTLVTLRKMLAAKGARDVRTVALLDKSARRIVDVDVEYRGFEVGDEFLLGYGLDWNGKFRNLRSLWAVMDMQALTDDPDRSIAAVFAATTSAAGRSVAR